MYFNVQLYCLYVRVIWLPILCLLPNPFEFVWIGKFRIYSMDCGCGDWFFVLFTKWGQKRIFCKTSAWRKVFFFCWLRGFSNEDPCKAIYELNPSFISKKENFKSFSQKIQDSHTWERGRLMKKGNSRIVQIGPRI